MNAKLTAWAVVCTVLAVWLMGTVGASVINSGRYHDAQQRVQNRNHFYQVIAGQAQPGTDVEDQLALDLRRIPNSQLRFFTGNANQYGGISRRIGTDPFTDSCGVECGRLRSDVLGRIIAARDGHVTVERAKKHSTSITAPLAAVVAWLILGLIAAIAAPLLATLGRRKRSERLRRAYPSECHVIDRLDDAMRQLPVAGRQYNELLSVRNGIEQNLQVRIDPRIQDDQMSKVRLDKLIEEARTTLIAIEEGNKALES